MAIKHVDEPTYACYRAMPWEAYSLVIAVQLRILLSHQERPNVNTYITMPHPCMF